MMTFPSAQDLAQLFDTDSAHHGAKLLGILQTAPNAELAMGAALIALDGYAVDRVLDGAGATIALYVSNGDAFSDTLFYDSVAGRFLVTSYAEWKYQRRMAKHLT